jgi:uncharacterized protein (TIGR00369 family)
MDDEPVRGEFPSPAMIGLPGNERRTAIPPPPIQHLFGLRGIEGGEGTAVFSMPASPRLLTPAGVFLAGVSALAADAPLGACIVSTLPPGVFGVTSELSMSFLRPAGVDSKELIARSHVVDAGRSLALSEALVEDASGRVLTHATSRYFLKRVEVPAGVERPSVPAPVAYDTPDPYLRPAANVVPDAWMDMSGLEVFRAAVAGEIPSPPFAELFGMRTTHAEEGSVTHVIRATQWLCSPARSIYGGILAFLADAAMSAAVATTLPARHSCATLDLKVQFLRPGVGDGRELSVHGSVVHRGKSIAVTRAEVVNADGKPLVLATGSTLLLARPWQPVAVADEGSADED